MEFTLPYDGALEYQAQDPRFSPNLSDPEAGARGQYLAVVCPEVPGQIVPDYLEACYWGVIDL